MAQKKCEKSSANHSRDSAEPISFDANSNTDESDATPFPRPPSRPLFSIWNKEIISAKIVPSGAPDRVPGSVIKFKKTATVGVIRGGELPEWRIEKGRVQSNPYRRYGTIKSLAQTSGGCIPKDNGFTLIKKGKPLPPPPPHSSEVVMNKDSDLPDSQTLNGSLKPKGGPATDECMRLAKEIEEWKWNGGFKPKQIPEKKKKRDGGSQAVEAPENKKKKVGEEKKK